MCRDHEQLSVRRHCNWVSKCKTKPAHTKAQILNHTLGGFMSNSLLVEELWSLSPKMPFKVFNLLHQCGLLLSSISRVEGSGTHVNLSF